MEPSHGLTPPGKSNLVAWSELGALVASFVLGVIACLLSLSSHITGQPTSPQLVWAFGEAFILLGTIIALGHWAPTLVPEVREARMEWRAYERHLRQNEELLRNTPLPCLVVNLDRGRYQIFLDVRILRAYCEYVRPEVGERVIELSKYQEDFIDIVRREEDVDAHPGAKLVWFKNARFIAARTLNLGEKIWISY